MAAAQTPELFSDRCGFRAQGRYLVVKTFFLEEIQYRVNATDLAAEVAGDLVGVASRRASWCPRDISRNVSYWWISGERRMPKSRRGALVIGSSELRRCPLASSKIAMILRSNSRSSHWRTWARENSVRSQSRRFSGHTIACVPSVQRSAGQKPSSF